MAEVQIVAERVVAAPGANVYRYISDYRDHHPRFLPPAFSDLRVEQGGVGDGTVISFRVTLGGRTQAYRQRIVEPEPGRILEERGIDSSEVTSFTVTPEGAGRACRVRIETRFQTAGGIMGLAERLLAPRLLRPLYADELERLDRYARERVLSKLGRPSAVAAPRERS